jgi:hypothetical protein
MPDRKRSDPAIEAQVLLKSSRRCCLCFHLHQDFGVKQGQIAHLDQNPSNGLEDNLAFLCMDHHSQYDSSTSQHKNFTIREVESARTRLYAHVQSTRAGVQPQMHGSSSATETKPSRTLRVTLTLPETLDQNLELYALKSGALKSEVIKSVLREFLERKGLQPDRRPKSIDIVY